MNSKAVRTVLWGAGVAVMTLVSFVAAERTSSLDGSAQAEFGAQNMMIAHGQCGGGTRPCGPTAVTAVRG